MRGCAAEAAAVAVAGDVYLLEGDLGAGKTEWVRGFVAGVGSCAEVTSPTFTLVHEYVDGRVPVYHWDLYRLDEKTDWSVLDLDQHVQDKGCIVLVEWPERYPFEWRGGVHRVKIQVIGENERDVCVC